MNDENTQAAGDDAAAAAAASSAAAPASAAVVQQAPVQEGTSHALLNNIEAKLVDLEHVSEEVKAWFLAEFQKLRAHL